MTLFLIMDIIIVIKHTKNTLFGFNAVLVIKLYDGAISCQEFKN